MATRFTSHLPLRSFTSVTRAATPSSQQLRIFQATTSIASAAARHPTSSPQKRFAHSSMDKDQCRGESTEGISEWKKRAPYRIHDANEHFEALYDAGCHCGRVKYQLSRKAPLDSKLCHCTTCQVQHAAPFQWAAIFHKDDINFSHGHHDLEWYDPTDKSIEHKLPCKVRCSYCHSPIMDEGRNMILLFPSLVHFKSDADKVNFKPRCHMFYSQRVMDIPDGLPKWSGINNDSDLIEDSPPDMVRDQERSREEHRSKKAKRGEDHAV